MSKLPTFLIIGAQRSGTTYLSSLLNAHPDVYMATPGLPEPKFFSDDSEFEQGMDYYSDYWFRHAGDESARGEKSISYLDSGVAAMRIRRNLPDAKLVLILRDPAIRAWSNWLYSTDGLFESLPFHDALIMEPFRDRRTPALLRTIRPWAYTDRSMYGKHLDRFLTHFQKEQILVLYHEEFFADVKAGSREVLDFIGVGPFSEAYPPWTFLDGPIHSTRSPAREIDQPSLEYLRELFMPDMELLQDLTGRNVPVSWLGSAV